MISSRGSNHVIACILLLALTVTTFLTFRGFYTLTIEKPTFVYVEIEDITVDHSKRYNDQIVIIRHIIGDSLNVKDLRLHVVVYRGDYPIKSCILQKFPWRHGVGINNLPPNAVVGDDIIDNNPNHYSRYLGELSYKSDGLFSPGETIGFRIKKSGLTLEIGDKVEVSMEYRGSIVAKVSKVFE
ncbi:hypothetical protein [Archaeoglobus profundus]|uniref:Archaeal Type IV pilin N-terminal domain-containing protein n=1 Tax=Archaeoglobus profundus (strain DSM 5631 / JCM 9629 / NBRC 100127 / Av18) TaxID=572546 RepID=D2RD95_ARCPA|nr:hypothetical protein [Archaeoglobus profundus]ADB58089.1 hypothetical protein Arcpr_1029 [Archaeoglobus profundus DSM 5631]